MVNKINNWTIMEKMENDEYYCICKCGEPKIMTAKQLKNVVYNKTRYCRRCSPRNKKT